MHQWKYLRFKYNTKKKMNAEMYILISDKYERIYRIQNKLYIGSLNHGNTKKPTSLLLLWVILGTIECKFLTSKDVWERMYVYMHRYNHLIVYQNLFWRDCIRIRFWFSVTTSIFFFLLRTQNKSFVLDRRQ